MGSSSGLASPFSLVTSRSRPSHPMIATASYSTCFNTSNKKRSHRSRLPTSAGNVAAYRSLDTRSHRVVRVVCLGGEQRRTEEELDSNSRFVRTLLIDNYDSYTYNIYQELSVVNGLPPVVVHNDERTMDYIRYCLYEEKAFDNIVISPGPGSPKCPEDVGICLEILLECGDIPILGVCLGHQALGFVHGAQVVHAPEPVHGRLSEIEHTGCNLFSDIPSGSESGFKVVRYHSLVLDADTLPKELIPIAWTTSTQTLSFLENQEFDMIPRICGNGNYPPSPDNYFANNLENKRLRSPYKLRSLNSTKVLMGIMHSTRPHYGVQFHPESVATSYGSQIFKNFKKMTIDYMLRSSPLHEINAHNGDAGISCAHQISKKLHKSKLLVNNVTAGHYSDIFTKTAVAQEVTGVKHLKLQWKKFDSLANQIGGSGNIFFELFGGQNAEDTFWLDSSSTDKKRARFSFMGGKGGALWKQITFWLSDHRRIAEGGGGYISIQDAHGLVQTTFLSDGFLEFLNRELQSFRYDKEDYEGLPFDFCGGFVGFIGYGLKVECGASSNSHKSTTPDACFFFADHLLVIDHSNNDVYLLYIHDTHHSINAKSVAHESWLDETEKRLLEIKAVTSDKLNGHKSHAVFSTPAPDKTKFVVEKSRDQYMRDVEQCLNFIRDGESYELCLTTQMKMEVKDIDALGLYLKIRGQNPAPYAAWLHFHKENLRICCSSPERFLRLDGNGTLEAKPIKGTIARGRTPEEDEHLRLQLQHSEKDRAENLMIVDLLRNDLGRVCEPGTVYVPHLIEVESYATVHTLVSTIRGKKKTDLSPIDCIRAAFPGGSMTGAPKLRSIKLLDSLECCSRGVYSGCIGFLSYNQTFDLNIVIRTVVINDGEASIGAGGAIVALSNPEDEYEEMMLKARAPAKAVEEFSRELNSSGIII